MVPEGGRQRRGGSVTPAILRQRKKTLAELAEQMEQYPQTLINVKVQEKHGWEEKTEIQQAISAAQQELGEEGRILVRASGTENLLRVMVEGKQQEQIERLARQIADVVETVMN